MTATHALLIVDGAGNVREWFRATKRLVDQAAKRLPSNGWGLYAITELPDGDGPVNWNETVADRWAKAR
jgi:hypothetical protein